MGVLQSERERGDRHCGTERRDEPVSACRVGQLSGAWWHGTRCGAARGWLPCWMARPKKKSPAYPSTRPHAPPSPGTGGTVSVADPGVGWPASRESRMSDVHDILFECNDVQNVNIEKIRPIISPSILEEEAPTPAAVLDTVRNGRKAVTNLVHGRDDRLMVVVGPCSIHDPVAALDYARRLAVVKDELAQDLHIVMRVYFEKPRTTIGWKGLINDPDLDGSHNIKKGIRIARQILMDINLLGLPCGCEFLDTISPQYLADLVTWGAIGARTTESQVHRELTSGLSMPVGFKNGTSGDVQIAADAIKAAKYPHSFLSVTAQGTVAIVETRGNDDCHLILRGGSKGTNYDETSVTQAVAMLDKAKVNARVVVDCSHGNSNKLHTNQPLVADNVAAQIAHRQHARVCRHDRVQHRGGQPARAAQAPGTGP